jgi:hypothetical protein
MSDFFDDLASYMATNGIGIYATESGRNIFVNQHPPDPTDCVSIVGLPGTNLDTSRDVPGLQFPRYQVIVRAAEYMDASQKFQDVRTLLHGMIGVSLDNYRVLRNHAEQEGGPIGQDGLGRHEFSCNFIAEYHAT